jgi:hypothetical protein
MFMDTIRAMRTRVEFGVVMMCLFFAAGAAAQVNTTAWPTVRILLSVSDTHSKGVADVSAESLVVKDNGQPVSVLHVAPATELESVCLLIDTSSSARIYAEALRQEALRLVDKLPAKDEICVATFDAKVGMLQKFSADRSELHAALSKPLGMGGATALYASIAAIADWMQSAAKNPVHDIVILTDGDDNLSRITANDVQKKLESMGNTTLWMVQWPAGSKFEASGLIERSGGGVYTPQQVLGLTEAVDELCSALAHRFVLEFTATDGAKDGKRRNLEIRSKEHGATVRSARAYWAPKG